MQSNMYIFQIIRKIHNAKTLLELIQMGRDIPETYIAAVLEELDDAEKDLHSLYEVGF